MSGIVCLTCDNMGSAVEVGLGELAGPNPADPSLTVGYPRWLALLEDLKLSATFFIEGWNGLHHPERVKELSDRGHEVGLHGWVHEKFSELPPLAAERVLNDSLAAFRNIGIKPVGFRAPGGFRGPHATSLLKKLDIKYDSSVDDLQKEVMEVKTIGDGIVNIPWRVNAIDYFHFSRRAPAVAASPEAVEREWDALIDEAAENNGLVTFIFHAMTIGVEDQRLAMASRVLRKALANPKIEVLRGDRLATRVKIAA